MPLYVGQVIGQPGASFVTARKDKPFEVSLAQQGSPSIFEVTEVDESVDPLVKAGGMQAMLAAFFKADKKAYKAFVKAKKSAGKSVEQKSDDEG